MISPTALFTFLAVAGGTFATGEPAGGRLAVLVAAAVFTVLCVAASRTLLALVAQALRSRRGRDLVIAGTGVLTVVVYLMTQSAHDVTSEYAELENGPLEAFLSWLPPGSIGAALLAARDGEWAALGAHLIVPLLTIFLLLAVWAWAIGRRVRVAGAAARTRTTRTRADLALIPLPFQTLAASPKSASAGQQFRYLFFRSAKATQGFLLPLVVAAIAAHASIEDNGLILSATIFVGIALLSSVFNVFGYDGSGIAYLATCAPPWQSVLAGKIIAPSPAVGLSAGLFVVVESIVLGRWDDSAAAILTALGLLAAGLGVGAMTSVRFPADVAAPGGSRRRVLVGMGAGLGLLLAVALLGGALWAALKGPIGEVGFGVFTILLGGAVGYSFYRVAARSLVNDPGRLVAAFPA
jgi:ABC-2 type transport system permease protein